MLKLMNNLDLNNYLLDSSTDQPQIIYEGPNNN